MKVWTAEVLFTYALFCCPGMHAQTVEEIVTRAVQARGGADRIKAIRTQRLAGTISFRSDPAGPFQVEMKRPGKMRQEIGLKKGTLIQTTDGKAGWSLDMGKPGHAPEPLSAEQLHNLAGGADIDGPLIDYKGKGNEIRLAGRVNVKGKDAYKLIVKTKDGEIRHDYIDCTSYLEVKWEGKVGPDGKHEVESYFSDYRPVNGVQYAFAIDSDTPVSTFQQKLRFDRIETDIPLDDQLFGRPVTPSNSEH